MATEGVDYGALLSTNFVRGGADPAGIRTMAGLINKAAAECPGSNILVGGYRYVPARQALRDADGLTASTAKVRLWCTVWSRTSTLASRTKSPAS